MATKKRKPAPPDTDQPNRLPMPKRAAHRALREFEDSLSGGKEPIQGDPLPDLLRLRRAAYLEHYQAMKPSQEIKDWAQRMSAAYGPKVQAHLQVVSWPIALLIGRYSEAIVSDDGVKWPDAFSDADIERAMQWETGGPAEFSAFIRPLPRNAKGEQVAPARGRVFGITSDDDKEGEFARSWRAARAASVGAEG